MLHAIWCWITHGKHHRYQSVHHSYACACEKCGRTWIEMD